ncbi:MAG: methionyl-tRNA formyltransferase [Alphaproteobacteria bacterium]|jgi:methionyl-tRNA formyltransferase|nr:methionyl-tRNA formyltransferase [Alphaproteobacteria bacterium]
MKICFMGTPTFASAALQSILQAGYDVDCVYTRLPKPAGRGQKVITSSVYDLATEYGIEIQTPKSLRKSTEEQEKFLSYNFDLVIVASYGLILPSQVINAPKYGCLNIHGSLLPRWRGASPIQMAIASGDTTTGITIMQMDYGLDTGDMLLKREVAITQDTTFLSLYNELTLLGAELIVEALNLLQQGKLVRQKQDDSLATLAPILTKEDGLLNFNTTAQEINQKVRGFNPFPTTYFYYKDEVIKVLETEVVADAHGYTCGEIINKNNKELLIACKNSAIKINKLQRPSKKPLLTEEVLRGFNFENGYIII